MHVAAGWRPGVCGCCRQLCSLAECKLTTLQGIRGCREQPARAVSFTQLAEQMVDQLQQAAQREADLRQQLQSMQQERAQLRGEQQRQLEEQKQQAAQQVAELQAQLADLQQERAQQQEQLQAAHAELEKLRVSAAAVEQLHPPGWAPAPSA